MPNHLDDVPPPPYSETDIYSNQGDPLSPTTAAPHHRRGSSYSHGRGAAAAAAAVGDAISVSQSSPPSTIDGEVIYTPPLTPRTGSGGSNFNFAGSNNSNSNSFSNYAGPTGGSIISSVDHLTTVSAQAYFDTRPAPIRAAAAAVVGSTIVHNITVRDDSSPDDFPFPAELSVLANNSEGGRDRNRDITPQDWQTFVNYLIPHHQAVNNERVIDRKLRAEGISPLSPFPVGNNNEDISPLGLGVGNRTQAEAEAQLDQIRSPLLGTPPGTAPTHTNPGGGLSESRRQAVEQTVREWNEGFFGPRGVSIRVANNANVEDVLHVNPMPGGWDASFDNANLAATGDPSTANTAGPSGAAAGNNNNNTNNHTSARSRFARFMPQFGGGGGGPGGNGPRGPFGLGIGGGVPGGSFRIGGIAVDGDRVSIGDRFVADRNGVRIGSFVADNNGISVNGQPMFGVGGAGLAGRGAGAGPGGPRGVGNPANGYSGWGGFGGGRGGCHDGDGPWGRGWGGRGGGRHGHGHHSHGWGGWHGPWGPGHDHDREQEAGPDEDHGRGFGGRRGRRGRRRERHHHDSRHRSRSRSVSSVSSTSSSSSSSSESSVGSLPEHDELRDAQLPVAKEYLLAWLHNPEQPITKEKLKDFKQKIREAKNATSSSNNNNGGINEPVNIIYDQKAMRKEVKALMREWKDLKKQQSRLRRQLRRERKQQRRAEKRERRETKREMKRAAREQKKRAARNGSSSSPSIPEGGPHLPGAPGGGFAPVIPPIPMPFAHFGGPFGNGQSSGRGGGGNGFFSPFNLFGGGGTGGEHQQPPYQYPSQAEGSTANRGGQAPGAWPSGDDHNNNNNQEFTNTIHGTSQAKYKAADELEAQLIQKETELFKLHETIALNAEPDNNDAGDAGPAASTAGTRNTEAEFGDAHVKEQKQRLEAQYLEEEIEDLAKKMALMRTEADAEYARELAGMTDSY